MEILWNIFAVVGIVCFLVWVVVCAVFVFFIRLNLSSKKETPEPPQPEQQPEWTSHVVGIVPIEDGKLWVALCAVASDDVNTNLERADRGLPTDTISIDHAKILPSPVAAARYMRQQRKRGYSCHCCTMSRNMWLANCQAYETPVSFNIADGITSVTWNTERSA